MNNKYALITGSSRGIGKAIALVLADDGFDIFVHCKDNIREANNTAQQIRLKGVNAYVLNGDLTKPGVIDLIRAEIGKKTRKLDVLVNNAGYDYGYMIEHYKMFEIRYIIDLVLTAKIELTKTMLPLLRNSDYGSIVNISSRMGKEKTIDTVGPYAASQAGVMKFTKCCALEFRDYRIRVNCVAPGLTRTDMTESLFDEESEWDEFSKLNPSGRVGYPEDIANVVSFLTSNKAAYVNGEILGVNGGSNLG